MSNSEPRNPHELSQTHPIVFFDGVCGFCNAVVDWVVQRDRVARFRFAPLQGETAERALPEDERRTLETLVVLKKGRIFKRSDAVAQILLELGSPWYELAILLQAIPQSIRDLGYKAIARIRYRIFGKRETCRIPTPEERGRFLD